MRKASEATQAFYEHGADLLVLAAARSVTADIARITPDEKLILLERNLLSDKSTLAPGTVCVYRQQISTAIAGLVVAGADSGRAEETRTSLWDALAKRSGTPDPERGASLKIEVPEKLEIADTFYLLKDRFFSEGSILDLVLCLYLLIVPRVGLRPIEVTWARRQGNDLIVATAKRSGRPERRVPLHGWPQNYLFALDVFLALVPRDLDDQQFKLWRNSLASRLARASKHSRKRRRLSLYCCRHIAIANWRDIGMSPQEIQRLAGHARVSSQVAYARGKAGYGAKWMLAEAQSNAEQSTAQALESADPIVGQQASESLSSRSVPTTPHLEPDADARDAADSGSTGKPRETDAKFEYDPFPRPHKKPQKRNYNLEAKQHFKQQEQDMALVVQRYSQRRREEVADDTAAGPREPKKRRD